METKIENASSYQLKHWEFMALWVEAVLLAATTLTLLWIVSGPGFLGSLVPLPRVVWVGLGFGLMGIVLYPVLSVQARNAYGHNLTFFKVLIGSLVGAVLGSLIYALLT